jgi:foldase protein PrsA
MKSKDNQSTVNQSIPITQRRLKTKPTLLLIALLFVGNLFWFILWLLPSSENVKGGDEQVATVDGETITRQQWMASMEDYYGKETLRNLVDEAVMKQAAEKYDIKVSDKEIDFEIALLRTGQDANDSLSDTLTDNQLRQKIKNQLILEKVLSKDIVIENDEVKQYYEDNKALYNIPTTYRTKLIIVDSSKEAQAVYEEIKGGSDFSVLAREKSVDAASASLGGSIGFISVDQKTVDPAIKTVVAKLKVNEISEPFSLSDNKYAVVKVEEVLKGQSFEYDDVKDQIKRTLALQQLPSSITAENFWDEFNAEWIYSNED